MANLITGNLFKLLYSDDPANNLPVGAGVYEITNLAAMPTLQLNSTQVTYETYDSTYTTVLLSNKNISPFEIIVNYVPDEASTVYLDNKEKTRDLFQVILNYRQTDGTIDYAAVAGYITGGSVTGSKDEVVRKTYTFTPQDLVVSLRTIDSLEPLYEGSYGVGSNGVDIPAYQPVTPEGNSFIKVPSEQTGNPAGADMLGIGLVDGTSVAELAMTKSGTLSLYAKNANTAWTRILTATQISSQYVPINRTVNGKPLSGNIVLDKGDVGLGNVTNDAQLTIENNLSDLSSAADARTNLDVYSKATVDTKITNLQTSSNSTYVPKTTTVNGKALSGNITLAKGDVGLGNVTNDAQLKITSNLSDLNNVGTARTNLGLGTSAVYNIGTSGGTIPLLNTANVWSASNAFSTATFGSASSSTGNGIEIGSLTTAGTAYIDLHSSGTTNDNDVRLNVTGGGATNGQGNFSIIAATVTLPNLTLNTALPITSGGTGANNLNSARTNLGVNRLVNFNNGNTYIYAGTSNKRLTLNEGGWWGLYDESNSSWQSLPVYGGGTGGTDKPTASASLGTFILNGQSVQPSSPNMNDFTAISGSAGEIYNVAATNDQSISNWPVNINGNKAYGWGSLLVFKHHMTNGGATQFYITDSESGEMYFRMRYSTSWNNWARFWTSRNTTIDANGFVKSASPIVKLQSNGSSVLNDESEGVTSERIELGVYHVYGTTGLNKDGWTIEIPQDINGNRLCFVETHFDETTQVLSIKTFTRKFDINTAMIVAGEPMDIPVDRWIDLRVEMPLDSIWNKEKAKNEQEYKDQDK
ncbi:pyocin knob domain-containing protein [Enterobacter kobei]|uniref:pyocin knob domain-containing protein n=1 Tax=Enterobacter kobei TaxID=208224 RepID=UPI0032AF779E